MRAILLAVVGLLALASDAAGQTVTTPSSELRAQIKKAYERSKECRLLAAERHRDRAGLSRRPYLSEDQRRADLDRANHAIDSANECERETWNSLPTLLSALQLRCEFEGHGATDAALAEATRCARWAEATRLAFIARQDYRSLSMKCAEEIAGYNRLIAEASRRSYTYESSRTYRDQFADVAMLERVRDQEFARCMKGASSGPAPSDVEDLLRAGLGLAPDKAGANSPNQALAHARAILEAAARALADPGTSATTLGDHAAAVRRLSRLPEMGSVRDLLTAIAKHLEASRVAAGAEQDLRDRVAYLEGELAKPAGDRRPDADIQNLAFAKNRLPDAQRSNREAIAAATTALQSTLADPRLAVATK